MSVNYGFYNAKEHDRLYEALDFGRIFDGIITDGVFESIGNAFNIIASGNGMLIYVDTGRAWFNHTWTYNDAIYPLIVPDSHPTLNRIDTVILEINASNPVRENSIKILKGDPNITPVPQTLINEGNVHQYPLAYITVAAQILTITDAMIEMLVGGGDCPYVSGVVDQLDVENLLRQWESDFNDHLQSWELTNEEKFESWFSHIESDMSEEEIGQILNELNNKEDKPISLVKTLKAGETSLTFVHPSINDNSNIEPLSDPYGLRLVNIYQTLSAVYLTFKPITEDAQIKILVRN